MKQDLFVMEKFLLTDFINPTNFKVQVYAQKINKGLIKICVEVLPSGNNPIELLNITAKEGDFTDERFLDLCKLLSEGQGKIELEESVKHIFNTVELAKLSGIIRGK